MTLVQVAQALGRPLEGLQELDRRPLRLAFGGRSYETVVVRDSRSGETIEATLDAQTGERVEAAELRRRDRELAEGLGATLEPTLRELLLRHPELTGVRVAVRREGASARTLRATPAEIVGLAREPDVTSIALAEDPEIPD